jgi:hypothetical protein
MINKQTTATEKELFMKITGAKQVVTAKQSRNVLFSENFSVNQQRIAP